MARNTAAIDRSDPLYEAYMLGAEVKREMLEAEGGVLSGKQFLINAANRYDDHVAHGEPEPCHQ